MKTGPTLCAVFSRRHKLRLPGGRASSARKGELRDAALRRYREAKRKNPRREV